MSYLNDLRLTNADVETMPDDGNRYELIDGKLYVSSPPSFSHQTILVNLAVPIMDYLRGHPIGRVVPGVGVIFDDYNGVIPDVIFVTHERIRKTLVRGRFHGAPEIVMEILSPGASNVRRDRQIKRSLYAARGAAEYWIVDPENRSVEVHRRNEAGELVF
jgi:Uma2 family endonuclease